MIHRPGNPSATVPHVVPAITSATLLLACALALAACSARQPDGSSEQQQVHDRAMTGQIF